LKNPIREEEYLARVQSTFFFSLCVFFLCSIILFFIPYGLNQYFTQIKKKERRRKRRTRTRNRYGSL